MSAQAAPVHHTDMVAAVYRQHYDDVLGFLRRRCHTLQQAEDLTQDTFLRFARWAQRSQWEDRGRPVVSMLYVIARRLLFDQAKRGHVRHEVAHDKFHDPGPYEPPVDELVGELVAHRRWRETIVRAVADLPDSQAEVLRLVYVEGLSHRDSSVKLGITEEAVKARVYRAMQTLRADERIQALRGELA